MLTLMVTYFLDIMIKTVDTTGCCLSLWSLRCGSHAGNLGFSVSSLSLAERRVLQAFFTQRGGRPSLSRFVFPSQLASLRGKSKSVGSTASHFEKTSHLPKCLMMRREGSDDLLFAPNMVELEILQ